MATSATERRQRIMNPVVLYGGFPVRYSTMLVLVEEQARKIDPKRIRELRDAYLMGHARTQRDLPDDVQPFTREEFETASNLPSGAKMPEAIWKKWVTIYPKEQRQALLTESQSTPAPSGMADPESGLQAG